jgi:4-hydroxybenzoate polyprenyltransferase
MKVRFKNSWRFFAIFSAIGFALIAVNETVAGLIFIAIACIVLIYSGIVT